MLIDCDTCRARGAGCADCVISLLLRTPESRKDLSEPEAEAFAALASGGILPPLRLVPVLNTHWLPGAERESGSPRAG